MKFYNTVLAICLLQESAAFFLPAQKTAFKSQTALEVSGSYMDTPSFLEQSQIVTQSGGPESSSLSAPNNTPMPAFASNNDDMSKSIWETLNPVTIQGGSLATLSLSSPLVERVLVSLKTEGRPLNANLDLWHGPDNTPQTMGIYIEDGAQRPFNAVIETPRGSNSLAIRNTGHMEFPMAAVVQTEVRDANGYGSAGLEAATMRIKDMGNSRIIQGGAVHTTPFSPSVQSVQVLLKTDGRPLNARIELLQGPNNNKQVLEYYSEDGMERPLFMVIETPGVGNVVRIVNTSPLEFPLTATVAAYVDDPNHDETDLSESWSFGGQ